jgi:hydroxyethylthiazole kinase-like uncharacterized protein yjeF
LQAIYRTAEIRDIEQRWFAANPGVSLMERAGFAAAEYARDLLGDGYRALVVCGPGNNGGDGFVAARHLRSWGYRVTAVSFADPLKLPADAAEAYRKFIAGGGTLESSLPVDDRCDMVIDALFGIGLKRPVEGTLAVAIEQINALPAKVLALDIPSGLDSDTGVARGVAVRATHTLTFLALKPGLLTGDAKEYCGEVQVAPLGVQAASLLEPRARLLDQRSVASYLARRSANTNKANFGSVGIIGGASGMVGACVLAARAALKLGAGRVYAAPLGGIPAGYDPMQPELMWREPEALQSLDHLTSLVVGPGLGITREAQATLAEVLRSPLPLIIDADALNMLAQQEPLQAALAARGGAAILTPHPGEAARLLGVRGADVQTDRIGAALKLAERFACHVLLKGAGSICAEPDGSWFINPTGNPGMASAGMGDVLSGMLAALLGQGLDAGQALRLGVYLHGAAADQLVAEGIGPLGLTASDVVDRARLLLNQWIYGPNSPP